jgi:hypothetical protein
MRFNITAKEAAAALHNDWFGVYCQNKKCGFYHDLAERRTENGQTFYCTRSQLRVKLLALGQKGEIKVDESFDFAGQAPFALLRGELRFDDGHSTKYVQLVAKDKGYEATVTIGKVTRKRMLNGVDFTLADVVSPAVWLKKGPAQGETVTFRDFSFDDLRMSKVCMKLLETKETVRDGANIKVNVVEKIEYGAQARVTSIIHYDGDARIVSGLIASMFEIRRESESDARKTEFGDDLVFAFMAKLDRPVGDLPKVKGLTLRGKGKVYGLLPDSALQTVSHEGDNVYVVKIGKHHGKTIKATEKEIRDALAETAAYPIHDAQVIELARKAIGEARTDRDKVQRLCKFVHEYIKYDVVYLPKVHDILERKVGDCKSYALLFTCLARAVGVPAREASGYFYMGDTVKGFGGHAWNEVVIDGHWVQVDATLGHTDLLPFYICVGSGADGTGNMTQTNGRLSFELIEVQRVP